MRKANEKRDSLSRIIANKHSDVENNSLSTIHMRMYTELWKLTTDSPLVAEQRTVAVVVEENTQNQCEVANKYEREHVFPVHFDPALRSNIQQYGYHNRPIVSAFYVV